MVQGQPIRATGGAKVKEYLLMIWYDVEPEIFGPFETVDEVHDLAIKKRLEGDDRHGYYTLRYHDDGRLEAGTFSGSFFDRLDAARGNEEEV